MKCCSCKKTVYDAIPYAIAYSTPFQSTLGKFICRKCLFIRTANEVISGSGFVDAQKLCAKLCSDNKLKYSTFVAQAMHRASRACAVSVYSAHASQIRKLNLHPKLAKALVAYLKTTFRIQETKEEDPPKERLEHYVQDGARYACVMGRPIKKWKDGAQWYVSKMLLGDIPYWNDPEKSPAGYDGWYENINKIYPCMRDDFKDIFEDPSKPAENEKAVKVEFDVAEFLKNHGAMKKVKIQHDAQYDPFEDHLMINVGEKYVNNEMMKGFAKWLSTDELNNRGVPTVITKDKVDSCGIHKSGARITVKYNTGRFYVYAESHKGLWTCFGERDANFEIFTSEELMRVESLEIDGEVADVTCADGEHCVYKVGENGWLKW